MAFAAAFAGAHFDVEELLELDLEDEEDSVEDPWKRLDLSWSFRLTKAMWVIWYEMYFSKLRSSSPVME